MMGSSIVQQAIEAGFLEPIDARLTLLGKTVTAVEQKQLKATNRLCGSLTKLIRSIKSDASASSEQIERLADYAVRVRAFNPRIVGKQTDTEFEEEGLPRSTSSRGIGRLYPPDHAEWFDEQRRKILSVPPVEDGFVRGFVDPFAAVDRVRLKYSQQPPWTFIEQEKLLQVALGETPLSAHAVQQLWLSLAYDFSERLECAEGSLTPETKWITSSICAYANRYGISIPTANCFTNFFEELAFRA
jgi:hypothetical protein